MQTTTETAIKAQIRDNRWRHAVHRILDRLRQWTRVYPMLEGDTLPAHDVVFVTGPDGGPERELADAMKTTPALWLHAVPPDVVMLPRSRLSALGADEDMLKWLENEAANIIERESQRRLRDEQIERQR